jgi:prophage regulatory protein
VEWLRTFEEVLVHDETALLDAIEFSIRLFVQVKALAEKTSSKSIRQNLRNAIEAPNMHLAGMDQLDGSSRDIVRKLNGGRSVWPSVLDAKHTLEKAYEYAVTHLPHGRRREHERNLLAALLRDALETHTNANATSRRGQVFEGLLIETFRLLGLKCKDPHILAERVIQRQLVSREGGGLAISTYELAPKKSSKSSIKRERLDKGRRYESSPHVAVPEETKMDFALINLHEVRRRIPRSRSTLYAEISKGVFPRPLKIGKGSYWRDDEVEELIVAYAGNATEANLQSLCQAFYERRRNRQHGPPA